MEPQMARESPGESRVENGRNALQDREYISLSVDTPDISQLIVVRPQASRSSAERLSCRKERLLVAAKRASCGRISGCLHETALDSGQLASRRLDSHGQKIDGNSCCQQLSQWLNKHYDLLRMLLMGNNTNSLSMARCFYLICQKMPPATKWLSIP